MLMGSAAFFVKIFFPFTFTIKLISSDENPETVETDVIYHINQPFLKKLVAMSYTSPLCEYTHASYEHNEGNIMLQKIHSILEVHMSSV